MTPAPLVVFAAAPETRAAFSVTETADLLGVSQPTVRKLVREGRLVEIALTDRLSRIPAWSIEAFLAPERRVTVVDGEVA